MGPKWQQTLGGGFKLVIVRGLSVWVSYDATRPADLPKDDERRTHPYICGSSAFGEYALRFRTDDAAKAHAVEKTIEHLERSLNVLRTVQ